MGRSRCKVYREGGARKRSRVAMRVSVCHPGEVPRFSSKEVPRFSSSSFHATKFRFLTLPQLRTLLLMKMTSGLWALPGWAAAPTRLAQPGSRPDLETIRLEKVVGNP